MSFFRTISAALFLIACAVTASAQSEYRIKPGDTLSIEVLEDSQLNRSVLVLPDGRFSFPFAGTIDAGGRTLSQIEKTLEAGISSNFAVPPNVFVAVAQRAIPKPHSTSSTQRETPTIDIYFLGEVNTPGLVKVEPGTTLLQALAQSGGFTRFAAQKRIQLRRADSKTGLQTVRTINFKAMSDGAAFQRVRLKEGDVILAPERRLFE